MYPTRTNAHSVSHSGASFHPHGYYDTHPDPNAARINTNAIGHAHSNSRVDTATFGAHRDSHHHADCHAEGSAHARAHPNAHGASLRPGD